MWADDQVLACVQVDIIAALFDAELALSVSQRVAKTAAKLGKAVASTAVTGVTSPVGRKGALAKGGKSADEKSGGKKAVVRIMDDKAGGRDTQRSGAGGSKGDESGRDADAGAANAPSPAVKARLAAECKKNNAWKAILAMQTVKHRSCEWPICMSTSSGCFINCHAICVPVLFHVDVCCSPSGSTGCVASC